HLERLSRSSLTCARTLCKNGRARLYCVGRRWCQCAARLITLARLAGASNRSRDDVGGHVRQVLKDILFLAKLSYAALAIGYVFSTGEAGLAGWLMYFEMQFLGKSDSRMSYFLAICLVLAPLVVAFFLSVGAAEEEPTPAMPLRSVPA